MRPRLSIVRTGPERPPFVLRWIWYFAPLLVATAMGGMILAARSAREAPPLAATLEAYLESGARVNDGARLRRGQSLHLVVAPAHARFVTISTSAGQVTRLGPLENAGRVDVPEPIPVAAPGALRVSASFDAERVVSLMFVVE